MLTQDHVRHVLAITLQDADTAARWNNALQALAESTGRGVPVNTSTDPRNGAAEAAGAEFATQAADVSRWPEGLGMAALFDPERVREYAAIISREYRALGITTVLGPQIDISTEPRWMRLQDTWGPSSRLVSDYTRAYCDGMQTTLPAGEQPGDAFGVPAGVPSRTDEGWGSGSIALTVTERRRASGRLAPSLLHGISEPPAVQVIVEALAVLPAAPLPPWGDVDVPAVKTQSPARLPPPAQAPPASACADGAATAPRRTRRSARRDRRLEDTRGRRISGTPPWCPCRSR